MGYLHITNLYKDQTVLMFREVYALEKLHGTSAHIHFCRNTPVDFAGEQNFAKTSRVTPEGEETLVFFSGGASINSFMKLFEEPTGFRAESFDHLFAKFAALGHDKVTVYGEAYGGAQQKQAHRYGPNLKFCVFDVQIGETWLTVPDAEDVSKKLGLEFVFYTKIPATVEALDAARDANSTQAVRNGITEPKTMEGVVIRPLIEMSNNFGRIIAKHKRPEERETATERKVEDPSKLLVLAGATEIANEWVTETRLDHVLDKIPGAGLRETGQVLKAMLEDVFREAGLEIVDTKEARDAITTKTRLMFHARVKKV